MAAFDVVVFGATSFVGQIICRNLLREHGAAGQGARPLRWAIAGRSPAKLAELVSSLGPEARGLTVLTAEAGDEVALETMCQQTRVVLSTVGPYALYGEPLVRTCARLGTDYVDLTGEPQFIQRMITRYSDDAARSGARIVHCCGFDSIPSDLGVWFLQEQARARFGAPCTDVHMRVKALHGGASGGTIASMLNAVADLVGDPTLRRVLTDPYALCPPAPSTATRPRQRNLAGPARDNDFDAWLAPFFMASINSRVVLRSHALQGEAFPLHYEEAMLMGKGAKGLARALALTAALGGLVAAAALRPTRWALSKVVPAPGAGPRIEAQHRGFFDIRFVGRTADGRTLRAHVTGDRDPGYGSTARMISEAAGCLALDVGKQALPGGFWTPATALGGPLLERLTAHAGLSFAVEP